ARGNESLHRDHSPRSGSARLSAFDPRARKSEKAPRETRSVWSQSRFPRAERHSRRSGAALQFVPRRLALREDSGRTSVNNEKIGGQRPPLPNELAARLRGFRPLGLLSILVILAGNFL